MTQPPADQRLAFLIPLRAGMAVVGKVLQIPPRHAGEDLHGMVTLPPRFFKLAGIDSADACPRTHIVLAYDVPGVLQNPD